MREPYSPVYGNGRAPARSPGRACEVAEPIDRNRHSVLERRNEKTGGQMSKMMLDAVNLAAEGITGESHLQLGLDRVPLPLVADTIQDEFQIWPLGKPVRKTAQDICFR